MKVNFIALNAQSGAGKDYTLALFNWIRSQQKYRMTNDEILGYIYDLSDDELERIHDVASGNGDMTFGNDVETYRFSTPLRQIVQAVAGTNFTAAQMDLQETKKHVSPILKGGQTFRDLHLILSDAVKQALGQETIFADILFGKVRATIEKLSVIDRQTKQVDVVVQDARYLFEVEGVVELGKQLQAEGHDVNFKLVNIISNTKNEINHSSEVDLWATHKHLFDHQFYNDKSLSTRQSLINVFKNFYEEII